MLLVAVAAVAAVAAYWMLVLTPKREEASKLSKSIATQQADLKAAQDQLATYEQAKTGYKANYALVARLGKAVPADDDTRSLMVQLAAAAGKSKVDFRTIQVGGGSGAPATPTPAQSANSAGSSSSSSGSGSSGSSDTSTDTSTTPGKSGSGSSSSSDSKSGSAAAPIAQPVTVPGSTAVGSAGFSELPFQFSFKGSFFNLGDFFQRLDRFVAVNQKRLDVTGRLMVLNNISLAPDATGFPNIRASIGATTYMLPATEGLTAGASPQGPGTATGSTPAAPGASASPAPSATSAPSTTTAAIGATR
jgi:Tfp pilus assembly protein PilO